MDTNHYDPHPQDSKIQVIVHPQPRKTGSPTAACAPAGLVWPAHHHLQAVHSSNAAP
jgi:hypothetical protein